MFNRFCIFLLATAIAALAGAANAQVYPNKPLRFIVTQGPGGSSDLFARTVAKKLGESLGQPVVVENRAGAEGIVGTEVAAKSPADGYTILFSANSVLTQNPFLYKKLPYDALKDFEPITLLGYVTYGIFVNPNVKANTLKEFIGLAKASPGKLNYGAGGTTARIGTEMFNQATGIKMTFVPYKSNPTALTDLIGGQIDMMLFPLVAAPYVKTGQLKLLAVHAPVRASQLPDTPTTSEAGVTNFEFSGWGAIHAPAGVPKDRLQKLNSELVKILAMTDVIEAGRLVGFEPQSSTPEQLDALVKSDTARYAKAIKEAGIPQE